MSASDWNPIARDSPEVLGVDSEVIGLLDVALVLDRTPPPEWVAYFDNPPSVSMPLSMHAPILRGCTIRIRPPDERVAEYVLHVDERIAAANEQYTRVDWPRVQEEREATSARAASDADRLARARKVVESL